MDDDDNIPLTFGKYAGKTPNEIADEDPGYIVWLYEQNETPLLSHSLYTACALEDDSHDYLFGETYHDHE